MGTRARDDGREVGARSVVVVGAGAIGAILAARLHAAGHRVTVVDTSGPLVAAVQSRGLHVAGPGGATRADLVATTRLDEAAAADLVIIATKMADVRDATSAALAGGALGRDTMLLTIQNGLGSAEAVMAAAPEARLVTGTVGRFGSRVDAPGRVTHDGTGVIGLGPPAQLREPLRDLLATAGFRVRCYESPDQLVWEKLVCNAGISGPCAMHGTTIGELMSAPAAWRMACGCAAEAFEVGSRLGVRFDYADPIAHLRRFGRSIARARPSMLQDLMAGRRCEIDAINGGVAAKGREVGVPTPHNDAVVREVRAREEGAPPRPTDR